MLATMRSAYVPYYTEIVMSSPPMTNVIAITNQKGGVGKTTTCVNLAASLSALHYQILLVDLDPQANATSGSGVNPKNTATIHDAIMDPEMAKQAIQKTPYGYDILPSTRQLRSAEMQLLSRSENEKCLMHALHSINHSYDFILIDCPPAFNLLTINALYAAQNILIPVQCEYYALEGLTSLLHNMEQLKRKFNTPIGLLGVLRTMYDPRTRLTVAVSSQLADHFGKCLFHTAIPRNVRLAEAPSHGKPCLQYDPNCQGAQAYLALASELIRRKMPNRLVQHAAGSQEIT
jgi:chromosome partitioning protein